MHLKYSMYGEDWFFVTERFGLSQQKCPCECIDFIAARQAQREKATCPIYLSFWAKILAVGVWLITWYLC